MRLSLLHKVEDAHEDAVWASAWVPSSNQFITGSVDEQVKLWQDGDGKLEAKHVYTGHTMGVVSVAVDSSGTYAASSALDSLLRCWNLQDQTEKHRITEVSPSELWNITFVPRSQPLLVAAAGGSSNQICVYNVETQALVSTISFPEGEERGSRTKRDKFLLSVAYSPDGRRMAAGGMDGTVAVYDAAAGKLLHKLEGHFRPVRTLCFTPDSRMLLTGCDDMHSHLYDVEAGRLVDAFSGHESWVLSVVCHPGGTAFVSGSSDCKIKLWEFQSRSCVQTVTEHKDQVWSLAFRDDGARLASVSDDKSVALFDFAA